MEKYGQYDWKHSQKAYEIFKLIFESNNQSMFHITATHITTKLKKSNSVITRQINSLKKAGLVIDKKEGKYKTLFYNSEKLKEIIGFEESVLNNSLRFVILESCNNFDNFIKVYKGINATLKTYRVL